MLLFGPTVSESELTVSKIGRDDAGQNPAGAMERLFNKRSGLGAEAPLEFAVEHLARRIGVVAHAAERLEEVPIALELVVVVAVRLVEQRKRLGVVRLAFHLAGER